MYNPAAKTEVQTDASKVGLGAVLLQKQGDKKFHPICFYNRKTTTYEAKYHSYELEVLPIVCALERFRVYLLGIEFVIRTSCNSLNLLEGKRDLNLRIGRWFVILSEFRYQIEYFKGLNNFVADGLSRNPVEAGTEVDLVGLPIMGIKITTDSVGAMQRGNKEIMDIRDKFEEEDKETHEKFTMCNTRVYRVNKGRYCLYVPTDLRYEIVVKAHRGLAHLGIDKTLQKVKESYYFPKMREFMTQYVNRYINCLYYKTPSGKKPGLLHPLEKGNAPFQSVHIDHVGPFVTTENEIKYVGAIVCGFSKYNVLKAVKDLTAERAVRMLKEFISHYGKPERLISDRSTAFTAAEFDQFCRETEIQQIKIASSAPRDNGQVERQNRVLVTCLATITKHEGDRDWEEKLLDVQWAINNSVHRVTKRTPYEIVFNHRAVGQLDNLLTKEIQDLNREMDTAEPKKSAENLPDANRVALKKQFDKHRKAPYVYKPGDLFLVLSDPRATGECRKLTKKIRVRTK